MPQRVTDYIDANADHPHRLGDLCRVAGCSAGTLEALVADCLGETPNRWLRPRRIWRARAMLAAADPATTTVAEIAVGCGFWELGRFPVAYVETYGESPPRTLRGSGRENSARSMPRFAKFASKPRRPPSQSRVSPGQESPPGV